MSTEAPPLCPSCDKPMTWENQSFLTSSYEWECMPCTLAAAWKSAEGVVSSGCRVDTIVDGQRVHYCDGSREMGNQCICICHSPPMKYETLCYPPISREEFEERFVANHPLCKAPSEASN